MDEEERVETRMLFITVIGVIGWLKGKRVGPFKGLYSCKEQTHT